MKNKMSNNLTELVFILDRSGSMAGLEDDTIGGYNSVLAKQKNEPGEALVTTVLFDDKVELLHDRVNIKEISAISDQDYFVRGSTALLDAVGKTIKKIVRTERQTSDDLRADKVMFVIITDGMENASREYNFEKIKAMILHEKEKYGWELFFLVQISMRSLQHLISEFSVTGRQTIIRIRRGQGSIMMRLILWSVK